MGSHKENLASLRSWVSLPSRVSLSNLVEEVPLIRHLKLLVFSLGGKSHAITNIIQDQAVAAGLSSKPFPSVLRFHIHVHIILSNQSHFFDCLQSWSSCLKKFIIAVGEMAEQFRVLAALPENLSLVSFTHIRQLTPTVIPAPADP